MRVYSDEQLIKSWVRIGFHNKVACCLCNKSDKVYCSSEIKNYYCWRCKSRFSLLGQTLLAKTRLALFVWVVVYFWLNCDEEISAKELGDRLEVVFKRRFARKTVARIKKVVEFLSLALNKKYQKFDKYVVYDFWEVNKKYVLFKKGRLACSSANERFFEEWGEDWE